MTRTNGEGGGQKEVRDGSRVVVAAFPPGPPTTPSNYQNDDRDDLTRLDFFKREVVASFGLRNQHSAA